MVSICKEIRVAKDMVKCRRCGEYAVKEECIPSKQAYNKKYVCPTCHNKPDGRKNKKKE